MLFVPYGPGFQKILYGPAAVRPAANYGASVVPGNNTKGSYTQLISGASLTDDAYGIWININSGNLATASRDIILDIGYDPAGGTSYTVLIADLLCSQASALLQSDRPSGGISYYFPLFIKSGTSIAAAASVNNATVGTVRCWARFYCKPKHPEEIKVGSFVESIGANAGSSTGVAVTPGTTSEGSWTSLGTTVKPCWHFQLGMGIGNGALTNWVIFGDLSAGAAGGELLLEDDTPIIGSGNQDSITKAAASSSLGGEVVGGATIWGRLQSSAAADTGISMMAYCVGG